MSQEFAQPISKFHRHQRIHAEVEEPRVILNFFRPPVENMGELLLDDIAEQACPCPRCGLTELSDEGRLFSRQNAFRLLMGDARRSPFAMTFHRLLAASPTGAPLPRPDWDANDLSAELDRLESVEAHVYEDELIAVELPPVQLGGGQQGAPPS